MFNDIIEKMKEQREEWNRDGDKLNENKESKLNQVMDEKVSEGVTVNGNYNNMANNNGNKMCIRDSHWIHCNNQTLI